MFNQVQSFYPNDFFAKLDFSIIKTSVKNLNLWYKDSHVINDYGSILTIENKNYVITINSFGKIQYYYNSLDNDLINIIVVSIEKIFKEQIENFNIKNIVH